MIKLQFHNKEELGAFIRLIQEIIIELESSQINESDPFNKFEIAARIELLEELLPKVSKKQFNQQVKSTIAITKAIGIIIFQYREIAVDIYADILKNRIVESIHREMV